MPPKTPHQDYYKRCFLAEAAVDGTGLLPEPLSLLQAAHLSLYSIEGKGTKSYPLPWKVCSMKVCMEHAVQHGNYTCLPKHLLSFHIEKQEANWVKDKNKQYYSIRN